MADFYDEDGDSNVQYSRANDDFYADTKDTGDLEFQDFTHTNTSPSSTNTNSRSQAFGGSSSSGSGISSTGGGSYGSSYGSGSRPSPFGSSTTSASSASSASSSRDTASSIKFAPVAPTVVQEESSVLDGDYSGSDFGGSSSEPKAPPAPIIVEGEDPTDGGKFWKIAFYRPLFNVDTLDVFQRLIRTVFLYPSLLDCFGQNPDLYGPFWIASTLIFLLGAFGNFATYLDAAVNHTSSEWHYDFTKVTVGAVIIYVYISVVPIALWAIFKWRDIPIGLVENCSLYGYSLFPYLPTALVMIVPSGIARWVIIMVAFALVSGFYVRNYLPKMRIQLASAIPLLLICVILNLGLAVAFRMYFFEFVSTTPMTPTPPPPPPAGNTTLVF